MRLRQACGNGAFAKRSIMDAKGVDMRQVCFHNTVLLRHTMRGYFVLVVQRPVELEGCPSG